MELHESKVEQNLEKVKVMERGVYFMRAVTTAFAFRLLRSVYVWPVPTKTIGCPVMYVIEMAAPTWKKQNYFFFIWSREDVKKKNSEIVKNLRNLTQWLRSLAQPICRSQLHKIFCVKAKKKKNYNVEIFFISLLFSQFFFFLKKFFKIVFKLFSNLKKVTCKHKSNNIFYISADFKIVSFL